MEQEFGCSHCYATSTPIWRYDPSSGARLCNACALYLSRHGTMRPLTHVQVGAPRIETSDECKWCTHCQRWRPRRGGRGKGQDVWKCSACAQYQRKTGKLRPRGMFNNKYQPRIRRQSAYARVASVHPESAQSLRL
ncbi:hypothetical protein R3P38DRAFT_2566975 [Favolaschia claudopus]|uniref:GATA-type domain-containing protein n=1 Tax=Favolaschia claudopus TaxID=2862362 RepID=A0AAV9ZXJ4_9AGAR